MCAEDRGEFEKAAFGQLIGKSRVAGPTRSCGVPPATELNGNEAG